MSPHHHMSTKRDKFKKATEKREQPRQEQQQQGSELPLDDFASKMYASLVQAERNYDSITQVSIQSIRPDSSQPRRAMPTSVRNQWNGDPASLRDVFTHWLHLVEEERGDQLNIQALVNGSEAQQGAEEDFVQRSDDMGPLEQAFVQLIDLAASIKREGLTNPVTVVSRTDGTYMLETGERRWLAFHVLYSLEDDEQWSSIPARVVEHFSVWRQATENNNRDDLNAIGKARQLALLLMDLHGVERFKAFDELVRAGGSDLAFYAQVADGESWRIPRGKSEILLQATGLKHPKQLRDYRALLRMDEDSWNFADDHNLTEGEIRQCKYQVPCGDDAKRRTGQGAAVMSPRQFYNTVRKWRENGRLDELIQLKREEREELADMFREWSQELLDTLDVEAVMEEEV